MRARNTSIVGRYGEANNKLLGLLLLRAEAALDAFGGDIPAARSIALYDMYAVLPNACSSSSCLGQETNTKCTANA